MKFQNIKKKECNDIVDDVYSLAHKIQTTSNIYERKKYEGDFITLRKMDIIYIRYNDRSLQNSEELNIIDEICFGKFIQEKQKIKNINEEFYEGLGNDLFTC